MDQDQKFEEIVNIGMEEYFKRNPKIAVQFGKEEYEKEVESGTKEHIVGVQVQESMKIILDIQLHCKQRSMADASKMLMNVLAMEETVAKAAILDFTLTPAYPLSYLIGKLLIEDLRQEVEEKMGSKFSLNFFHDTILRSGDLPYYLLKEYFEEKMKNL